jgi:hypothetical protein
MITLPVLRASLTSLTSNLGTPSSSHFSFYFSASGSHLHHDIGSFTNVNAQDY